MLLESDRANLEVYSTAADQHLIAKFENGKFETKDDKTIKILKSIEGVNEAIPDYYDLEETEDKTQEDNIVVYPDGKDNKNVKTR